MTLDINSVHLGTRLNGATVTLRPNQLHAIVGRNGSGKSSLIQVASGLLKPASGAVSLNSKPLHFYLPNELASTRAVMPQQFNTPFALTVAEVIDTAHVAQSKLAGDRARINQHYLQWAQINALAMRPFNQLSGGEQARVLLARSLAQIHRDEAVNTQPAYLLLDEPSAALDLYQQQTLLRQIKSLVATRAIGVLAVFHDLNLVAQFADTVTLMDQGRTILTGAAREVLTSPALASALQIELETVERNGQLRLFVK